MKFSLILITGFFFLFGCKPKNESNSKNSPDLKTQIQLFEDQADSRLFLWKQLQEQGRYYNEMKMGFDSEIYQLLSADIVDPESFIENTQQLPFAELNRLWASMEFQIRHTQNWAKSLEAKNNFGDKLRADAFAYQRLVEFDGNRLDRINTGHVKDLLDTLEVNETSFLSALNDLTSLRRKYKSSQSFKEVWDELVSYTAVRSKQEKNILRQLLSLDQANELGMVKGLALVLSMPDIVLPEYLLFVLGAQNGGFFPYFTQIFSDRSMVLKLAVYWDKAELSLNMPTSRSFSERINLISKLTSVIQDKWLLDAMTSAKTPLECFVTLMQAVSYENLLSPNLVLSRHNDAFVQVVSQVNYAINIDGYTQQIMAFWENYVEGQKYGSEDYFDEVDVNELSVKPSDNKLITLATTKLDFMVQPLWLEIPGENLIFNLEQEWLHIRDLAE